MNTTPITDLVDLCRHYTRQQWAEASFRAASPWVDEVCNIMARHAPDDSDASLEP